MSELNRGDQSALPPEAATGETVSDAGGLTVESLSEESTLLQRLGDVARGAGPKEYIAAAVVVGGAVAYLLARRKGWLNVSEGHGLSLSEGDKHSAGFVSVVEITNPSRRENLAASFPKSAQALDSVRDGVGLFALKGDGESARPLDYDDDVPAYRAAMRSLAGKILRAWPKDVGNSETSKAE